MSISKEAAQELLDQVETLQERAETLADMCGKVSDNLDTLVRDASPTLVLPAEYDRRTLLILRELVHEVRWDRRHRPADDIEPHHVAELRRLLTYLADNA